MRYSHEVLLAGALLAAAGWYARAPTDTAGRAAYLCAPIDTATQLIVRLQAALSDHDQVVPPFDSRMPDLARDCQRLILRLDGAGVGR